MAICQISGYCNGLRAGSFLPVDVEGIFDLRAALIEVHDALVVHVVAGKH